MGKAVVTPARRARAAAWAMVDPLLRAAAILLVLLLLLAVMGLVDPS